jgi:LCP family protein required for cell wall assembly
MKQKINQPEVDFLQTYNNQINSRLPRKNIKTIRVLFLIFLVTIFLSGSLLFSNYLSARQNGNNLDTTLKKLNLWSQLSSLIGIDEESRAAADRINIVFFGMGGIGHDGPFLTDTIIWASFKESTAQLALVSIPRDLVVKYTDSYYPKINELYTLGRKNDVNDPAAWAADIIGENFNQIVDYYVIVDFQGFVDIIDALDGIDVDVETAFTDTQYPTDDFQVQTVSFSAGWQTMSGARALEYVRSRHGDNGEGSDFARSQRQQKLLFAIKDKVLSYNTLLNPYKLSQLYEIVSDNLETNISLKNALKLYDAAKDIEFDTIIQYTLDDSVGGLLAARINDDGAYILEPKSGYESLQSLFANLFEFNESVNEEAKIEIRNGTNISGLAYGLAQEVWNYNLTVTSYKNADTQDYQRTIIYDLTAGEKPKTAAILKQILPDAIMTTSLPAYLQSETTTGENESADFIIILGQDRNL